MAVKFWRRPLAGRSAVHAKNGLVASSQPLASSAGLEMLKAGGNASDAIIAMAAVLNVVEPFSTGIGGDAFALLHVPGESVPIGINGSGFSPQKLSYDFLVSDQRLTEIPKTGILPITVPGAVSTWGLIHGKYGSLPWEDVLQPAINYANTGFPVSPLIAQVWKELVPKLKLHTGAQRTYLIDDERAPRAGEMFKQEQIGKTFQQIAKHGFEIFYQGDLANRIIKFLQSEGSVINSSDLHQFSAEWTKPISKVIYDHRLWQHGPNGQGLVTLQILSIAE